MVAFRLVTGKLPFEAPTELALMYQIVHGEPVALSAANPRVEPAADFVMRRALAKTPETRFAICAAFAAALGASLGVPGAEVDSGKTTRTLTDPDRKPTETATKEIAPAIVSFARFPGFGHADPTPPAAVPASHAPKVNPKDGLTNP